MDDKAKIASMETRLKKLENIFYGISDDPRVKEVIRKNVIVEVTNAGNPVIMDKMGTKYELMVGGSFLQTANAQEVTISGGVITITQGYVTVDTEGDAATDDLDTISAPTLDASAIIVLRASSNARTVVLKDGTGNLRLAGDFSLDHNRDTITLIGTGGLWYELSRSDNDA